MVRRHGRSAFMGGAHVFPGGRVDLADGAAASAAWCDGLEEARRLVPGAPAESVAFSIAGVRELFEEAGVLLARDRGGRFVAFGPEDEERLRQYRARVHDSAASLRPLVEAEGYRLALDALIPFAHWVTPPIDVRQFDTRFFVARMPPGQSPVHDEGETTHSTWIRPADAIQAARADEMLLPIPTWTTLRELERFAAVDLAIAWARERPIVRRQPLLIERDGLRLLVLPGDPLHPEPAGEPILSEVRFAYVDERWRARGPAT